MRSRHRWDSGLSPESLFVAGRRDLIEVHTTACLGAVDLTDRLQTIVSGAAVEQGLVLVQSLHTTASIVVNENEPLLWEDLRGTLERIAPRHRPYRHDDFTVRTVNLSPGEPANGHSHCKSLFLPTSVVLGVSMNRLTLGRWQRVFLLELDGPRLRTVSVMMLAADEPR